MSTLLRHILLVVCTSCIALMILRPCPTAAQPLPLREGNSHYVNGDATSFLFLKNEFIHSLHNSQLLYAQRRHFREQFRQAFDRGDYNHALACTDSLILLTERYNLIGVRFFNCYKNRALTLHVMQRDSEACVAFERATKVIDSLMKFEQDDVIRGMQESYDLDRLALDRALFTAEQNKTTLITVLLLLSVVTIAVGFIYTSNRRTRRLRCELQQQMEEAQNSEQKKITFINSMCHEVRTPLNSIAGFSELLCEPHVSPDAMAQYCHIIQENREQLRDIFNDMLEVAYLEVPHEPLSLHKIDVCTLCRQQFQNMKIRFPKSNVQYTNLIPHEEIIITSNERYLGLLLEALLNNAYKFTKKGFIHLECGKLNNGRIYISVTDTGCGIPADQHAHVFERFIKLDTFSPGNGLGLYLCRLIGRDLQCTVHIDTTYTAGTRFVVTLPQ